MKYGPRKSAEIAAKAADLRKAGLTWMEIERQLDVTKNWLDRWMAKIGFKKSGKEDRKSSPENLRKARELRAAGICWKMVARQVGIDHWRTLQRAITMEDKLQAEKDR